MNLHICTYSPIITSYHGFIRDDFAYNENKFIFLGKLDECKLDTDDNTFYDIAGLIYYNSNSLKDGTYIYNSIGDYEPTVIVGSRFNRCVFYDPKQPHSPTMEQSVEERWTQPFFLIYKEETFKKFKEDNN